MTELYPTIGLEIHVELMTKTKIFCSCPVGFGGDPNTRCCPVCSGMPGALPVLNRRAVELAIMAGTALNCNITSYTEWDRKNYFYPDLPKAYQISQLNQPICIGGYADIIVNGIGKRINIDHIHLEEDAGKLTHISDGVSLADYNRCGVPLIEIVTRPDMHSAEEAVIFIEKVRSLLTYVGVTDGKMEQGSLRCDVNISVAEKNSQQLGVRTELKNMNSLSAVSRAVNSEISRQSELINRGETILQQTLRFDEASGETLPMRSKEDQHDYRYFPEPDLPPLVISSDDLNSITAQLPESAEQRRERYLAQQVSIDIVEKILADRRLYSIFDAALVHCEAPAAFLASYITGELQYRINLGEVDPDDTAFSSEYLAALVTMLHSGKLSQTNARIVLRDMLKSGKSPQTVADEMGLWIDENNDAIAAVVDELITGNPTACEQYRNGSKKVLGFFIGRASRELKGRASAKDIERYLLEKLEK